MPLCELSSLPVRKSFLSANLRPCCCLRESVEGGPWNYVDMGGSQAVNGAWDHRFKGPGWSRGMVQDEAGSPTRSKEGLGRGCWRGSQEPFPFFLPCHQRALSIYTDQSGAKRLDVREQSCGRHCPWRLLSRHGTRSLQTPHPKKQQPLSPSCGEQG